MKLYQNISLTLIFLRCSWLWRYLALGTLLGAGGQMSCFGGVFLYASLESDTIFRFDSSGNRTVVASGLSQPRGLAFGPDGSLYAAIAGNNTILKIDPSGTKTTFPSVVTGPRALVFGPDGGLYVGGGTSNTIVRLSLTGGSSALISNSVANPRGLAFDSAGKLYAASSNDNTVTKIDIMGASVIFADSLDNLNRPYGIVFHPNGNLLVTNFSGLPQINAIAPDGTSVVFASNSALNAPYGMAFDDTGNLFVATLGGATIEKFKADGTYVDAFASNVRVNPQTLGVTFLAFGPAVPEPGAVILFGVAGCVLFMRRSR